jgi:hypothetical protein
LLEYVKAQCDDFDKEMAKLPRASGRDTTKPFLGAFQSTIDKCKILLVIPTGALSGEMAHRILDNHELLVNLLAPRISASRELPVGMNAERRAVLTSVFAPLRALCTLMQRPAPLCDACIDEIQHHTDKMARAWHAYFPGHITPKQHMLFVDVPRFARQHRTVSSAAVPTHERGTAYKVWWKSNESDV